MRVYAFEKLEAWQLARRWRIHIVQASMKFPDSEKFGLTNQIRRAAYSVTANLAEGEARYGTKDRLKFVNIAYASALEVLDHIITAFDSGFIDEEMYLSLRNEMDLVTHKLERFAAYLNQSIQHPKSN